MNRLRHRQSRGIVLPAVLMLVVFAAIVALSCAVFVVERLRGEDARAERVGAVYLAQAGIQGALYSYRVRAQSGNGYFPLGQFNVDAQRYFVLGGDDADLLMVDSRIAFWIANGRTLRGIQLQNATNSRPLTITGLIVAWNNNRRLRRIRIGNSWVWNGNSTSPAFADIDDVTLDAVPNTVDIDAMRFSGDMSSAAIYVRFIMNDGSYRDNLLYPSTQNFNFTVRATGQRNGSPVYRTIEADYNAARQRVTRYEEVENAVLP